MHIGKVFVYKFLNTCQTGVATAAARSKGPLCDSNFFHLSCSVPHFEMQQQNLKAPGSIPGAGGLTSCLSSSCLSFFFGFLCLFAFVLFILIWLACFIIKKKTLWTKSFGGRVSVMPKIFLVCLLMNDVQKRQWPRGTK